MRAAFATLGCKVNQYESEAMKELFMAAGWEIVSFTEEAEAYIVNTCTVTATADGKSRQFLSRAHALNPKAVVAAVGCYAQSDPDGVAALPGVSLVVGTDGRKSIVERVTAAINGNNGEYVEDLRGADFEPLSAVRDGHTRATLKIQDGCTNYCSYCIIPYVRGPLRSRALSDVEKELRALAGEGFSEVVLTGIHLASYGRDTGEGDLIDVLGIAERIDGIERVRLGSLEPKFVDGRFVEAAAKNRKLCDQFHLSLQSGSGSVLKRMKRRYTPEEFAHSAALLRSVLPNCALTTDVIAGFPGETEAEHAESLAFCGQMAFSRMHVFPYSRRPGTVAADMPGQLDRGVKAGRAHELIALGKQLTGVYLDAQIGRLLEVLPELNGTGYAKNYVLVKTGGRTGRIQTVRITGRDKEMLIGKEENA